MLSFLGRYSYKVHQGDLITVPAEKILHNLQTSVKRSTQNPLHQVVWRMNSTAEDDDSYCFDSLPRIYNNKTHWEIQPLASKLLY